MKFSCYFPSLVIQNIFTVWPISKRTSSFDWRAIVAAIVQKAGDWISVIKYYFNYCDGANYNDSYVTVKNNIKKE